MIAAMMSTKLLKMRCDRNGGWDVRTQGKAPHKPMMMLAVLDLMETGQLHGNLIPYDDALLDAFDLYWSRVFGTKGTNPLQPFWHLKSEGHWMLVPQHGCAQTLAGQSGLPSLAVFRRLARGACLSDDLWREWQDPVARATMRAQLLAAYFDAPTAILLAGQAEVAQQAHAARQALTLRSRKVFTEIWEGDGGLDAKFTGESRQMAFRQVVVAAYTHACAACGTHIRTQAGHSCLQAAHIIPFSVARNDDPRNGLGLCPLHHWAFDQGMMGVAEDCTWIIHPYARQLPASGDFLALAKRPLRLPDQEGLQPAAKALAWHRREVMKG